MLANIIKIINSLLFCQVNYAAMVVDKDV